MPEAPADPSDPQRDLLEEMQYALRLAEERERIAREEMDWIQRQFVAEYSELEERARSAEKNADRAELNAAAVEDRVNKSLQALRLLRCRLISHAVHV
jgi:signal transduction histidine kinase